MGFEPNLGRNTILTPAQYTALLCEAYSAIKEASPDTLVISGAPFPSSWWGDCTPAGCDDLLWINGLAEAGAADCLGYVGVHYTQGATSPSERSGHPMESGAYPYFLYYWPMVESYSDAFGGARPLAFTQFGYLSSEGYDDELPEGFTWAAETTAADQAAWTAEAVRLSIEDDRIGMLVIYNWDYTWWQGGNVSAGWALMRPDGTCPTCDALRQLLSEQ